MYKRNRMIVTNPVVTRKDPTFNTTTYDWAPAGLNQTLVRISVKYRRFVCSYEAAVCCSVSAGKVTFFSPTMLLRADDWMTLPGRALPNMYTSKSYNTHHLL